MRLVRPWHRRERMIPIFLAAFAVLAVCAVVRAGPGLTDAVTRPVMTWVAGAGWWGAVVFVAAYVATAVLLLPGFFLTFAAGAIFGLARGAAIASVSVTLGAGAAFLVSRHLARERVRRKVVAFPRLARLATITSRHGWRIVLAARLSPLVPFRFSNYLFGITEVGFAPYLAATWIGTLPSSSLAVYTGSAAGDVMRMVENGTFNPFAFRAYLLGLAALLTVSTVLAAVIRRSLRNELEERESGEEESESHPAIRLPG